MGEAIDFEGSGGFVKKKFSRQDKLWTKIFQTIPDKTSLRQVFGPHSTDFSSFSVGFLFLVILRSMNESSDKMLFSS